MDEEIHLTEEKDHPLCSYAASYGLRPPRCCLSVGSWGGGGGVCIAEFKADKDLKEVLFNRPKIWTPVSLLRGDF